MRRKEERSKQGQTNNKAKQHSTPKAVTFPRKMSCLGWDMYTDTCTAVQCINVNIGMVYAIHLISFFFFSFFNLPQIMQLSTCKCWIGLY